MKRTHFARCHRPCSYLLLRSARRGSALPTGRFQAVGVLAVVQRPLGPGADHQRPRAQTRHLPHRKLLNPPQTRNLHIVRFLDSNVSLLCSVHSTESTNLSILAANPVHIREGSKHHWSPFMYYERSNFRHGAYATLRPSLFLRTKSSR